VGGEGFSSTAMKELWEKRRQKKLEKWRNEYDKNMEWRNKNYEFFNKLIQSVINNRDHVYNYDTNGIN
jgi:ribosomal protein L22